MRKKILIATTKSWNTKNAEKLKNKYVKSLDVKIVSNKDILTNFIVKKFNPEYIFFPHWSWIISEEIYKNYECVLFHMTDLPFGRGGSPLQNLILRNLKKTKISAIRVIKELDAGPVYMKCPLLLSGTAQEIYERASKIIFEEMVPYIIENDPKPVPQKGTVVSFKRRESEESKIPFNISLSGVYDYIRMLDAEGYPPAFLETENLKLKFRNAKKNVNSVEVNVYIEEKKNER